MDITPEMIEALRTLRTTSHEMSLKLVKALATLDNAGIFAPIDEATGYDVDPAPERVSKCDCWPIIDRTRVGHNPGCPGDPEEWGDMAYKTPEAAANERLTAEHNVLLKGGSRRRADARKTKERRPCPADGCTLSFAVNKDGTLHKHLNDMMEPCSQKADPAV